MSRSIGRTLLVMVFAGTLLIMSSDAPVAYCQSCPEARLSADIFIRCLDGQNAECKTGPNSYSCRCSGSVKKDNQCGGACSVWSAWGKCAIECRKGVHATCKVGDIKWQGLKRIVIPPHCSCDGSGSVSKIDLPESKDDALTLTGKPFYGAVIPVEE